MRNKKSNIFQVFKKATRSVGMVFHAAPGAMILKCVEQIFSACMGPLSLYFMQRLVDSIMVYVEAPLDFTPVFVWALLLVLAAFFSDSINSLGAFQVVSIQRKLDKHLTRVFLNRLKTLDYACFEDSKNHDALERIGMNTSRRVFFTFRGVLDIVASIISVAGLCIVVSQVLSWISFGLFFILIALLYFQYKGISISKELWNQQAGDDRAIRYITNLLSSKHSLYELKVFGAVPFVKQKWSQTADKVLRERAKTLVRAQLFESSGDALSVIWQAAIAGALVSSLFAGTVTLGLFISLMTSTRSISNTREVLNMAFRNITVNQLEMEHYDRLMALPTIASSEHTEPAKSSKPSSSKRHDIDGLAGIQHGSPTTAKHDPVKPHADSEDWTVVFEGVSFAYPGTDRLVLKNVSFCIDSRQHTALVGRNGAGKSTIIKLLCKLYKPQAGVIRVNGKPLNDISASELTRLASFIFQDFSRYELSLRENIALGCLSKLHEDEALKEALALSTFHEPSLTLDTNLGKITSDGIDLSGGQWQKLALARALIANSNLVILDEPTASLDPLAESEMYASFSKALHGRGCLMISHRLASAKLCNTILVIDEGTIVEQGSHEELMQSTGLYHKMFSLQSSWYSNQEEEEGGEIDD